MSLRHKLVLLLAALALVAVCMSVAVAWGDVRQAAREAADERLARATEQLVGLIQASVEARHLTQEEVAARPSVRALLQGRVDSAAVVDALGALRTAADPRVPIHVVDRDGSPVFSDLAAVSDIPPPPPDLEAAPAESGLRREGDEVRYWSTTPVRSGSDEIIGWIVQERRLGSSGTAIRLQDLIGRGSRIVVGIPGEDVAVTLAGQPVAPPPGGFAVDSLLAYDRENEAVLARAARVPGSSWTLLVETPAEAVGARASEFLRRMSVLAVLLVLGTVLMAYALGRRLTDPIEELAAASEAVARGDYTGEVPATRGGDELDRLARSFNEMAARVTAAREQLEERLAEERALARELEDTSARAEEAREEAQRANRAKSEFLATMSHEVRTPINAILGYCDLLELEIPDPLGEGQREKVKRIRRSSRILEGLVEDVLDFAKLDSGRLRVERAPAAVREAVLGASAVVEPQAERAGLPIEIEVDPELRVLGDRRRVEQILVNLLSNAVKFTDEGQVRVRARAGNGEPPPPAGREGSRGGEWVRIEVEDTGPGIPDEQMERVFDPFVQGQSGFTRPHGGTGLGLSISRELARMMGGDLTVTSRVAEGSCFSLWLPEAPPDGSGDGTGDGPRPDAPDATP